MADGKLVPSWVKYNAAKKTVELRIVAAYNGNNGSWNYNGYYAGGATVVVPLGSKVVLNFENPDGNFAHSLLVTDPFAADELPPRAGREYVAISRAYTNNPTQGCLSCKERLRFKARKEGRYWLYCGVVGHGQADMWLGLVVSAEADVPYIEVAGDAIAPDDQPPFP